MHTHITFVLDSSGSMARIQEDTKGGFNAFLKEQIEEEGTASVSLYEFDSSVELVYHAEPIESAPELTSENYRPGGNTALYDALVEAIDTTGDHVEALSVRARPDNVIIAVVTDGRENASETPRDVVWERVKDRRENDGWEFLLVGANQDAALTAESMGMDRDNSLNMHHSNEGAASAMQSTSRSIARARRKGDTGGFTDVDRRWQDEAGSQ